MAFTQFQCLVDNRVNTADQEVRRLEYLINGSRPLGGNRLCRATWVVSDGNFPNEHGKLKLIESVARRLAHPSNLLRHACIGFLRPVEAATGTGSIQNANDIGLPSTPVIR